MQSIVIFTCLVDSKVPIFYLGILIDVLDGVLTAETWKYHAVRSEWMQQNSIITARTGHCMEWDPKVGRLILFGGRDASSVALPDAQTYALGGSWVVSNNYWSNSRYNHACAIDAKANRMYVYAGLGCPSCKKSDIYYIDLSNWQTQSLNGGSSTNSFSGLSIYATTTGEVFYFLGYNDDSGN